MVKINVPLLKQQRKLDCGPTALRMVIRYFGKRIPSREIIKESGGIKKYGVKTTKLADFAGSLGFKIHCYSFNKKLAKGKAEIKKPSKSLITKFLHKKLPVIIAVRSYLLYCEKPSDEGHFIVVTGYENGRFWYNDPKDGKRYKINDKK